MQRRDRFTSPWTGHSIPTWILLNLSLESGMRKESGGLSAHVQLQGTVALSVALLEGRGKGWGHIPITTGVYYSNLDTNYLSLVGWCDLPAWADWGLLWMESFILAPRCSA